MAHANPERVQSADEWRRQQQRRFGIFVVVEIVLVIIDTILQSNRAAFYFFGSLQLVVIVSWVYSVWLARRGNRTLEMVLSSPRRFSCTPKAVKNRGIRDGFSSGNLDRKGETCWNRRYELPHSGKRHVIPDGETNYPDQRRWEATLSPVTEMME